MNADELFEQIEFAVLTMSQTGDRARLIAAKAALREALATPPQPPVRLVEGGPREIGQALDKYGEHKDRP